MAFFSSALAEATNDFQRLQIRDVAKAVAAAAKILEHREIQVQAANLVMDAERAIAKANPPNVIGRPKKVIVENNDFSEEPAVKPNDLVDTSGWETYECKRCDHASLLERPPPAYCKYCYETHDDWEYGYDHPQPEEPETEPAVKPQAIREMRQAHNHLSDEEYEEVKTQAVETQTPLTRAALKKNTFMARATGDYEWYTPPEWITHETH